MYFVGIDLAWSKRNGSGIVILKGNRSKAEYCCGCVLYSDDEIINYINKTVKDKEAFVAIDAPLIVPNEQGRRRAEELTGFLFRRT